MRELYIGNLLYDVTLEELHMLLTPYGQIHSLDLFTESGPGRPHAYAFVVMEDEAAMAVQHAFDRSEFMGRTLRVELAKTATVEEKPSVANFSPTDQRVDSPIC